MLASEEPGFRHGGPQLCPMQYIHVCAYFIIVQCHGMIYEIEATGGRRKCMVCRTRTKIRIVIANSQYILYIS